MPVDDSTPDTLVGPLQTALIVGLNATVRRCCIAVLLGATFGLIGFWSLRLIEAASHRVAAAVALGAVVGLVAVLIWTLGLPLVRRARVTNLKLALPGAGDMEIEVSPPEREQLWAFFVALASRIATRAIPSGEGSLREALDSLHEVFSEARKGLAKLAPDSGAFVRADSPAVYVLSILNRDLRPALTRWHPRLKTWEATGRPESSWPLADACRRDLEVTRQRIVLAAYELGAVLGIGQLDRLMPERPLVAPELALHAEPLSDGSIGLPARQAAWRICVEGRVRVPIASAPPEPAALRRSLENLAKLQTTVVEELKNLSCCERNDVRFVVRPALQLVDELHRLDAVCIRDAHQLSEDLREQPVQFNACAAAHEAARTACLRCLDELAQAAGLERSACDHGAS